MRVLSYGATGAQGAPVAQQLLERGHKIHVIVRHPEKAASLEALGASVFKGDLGDPSSLDAAHEGVDAVFLVLPFSGGGNPLAQADGAFEAAKRAGVQKIVLNTSGQTPREPTGLPMMDYRIALEGMLHETGIPATIIRPTAYMENFLGPWTLPGVLEKNEVAYPIAVNRPTSWIAAQDVARFVVAALEHRDLAGRAFDVGGPEALTGDRIAESFSAALGKSIHYRAISPDEFADMMGAIMGPEAAEGIRVAYRAGEAAPLDAMKIEMQPVLAELPVQLTTLEEWVRMHAAAFSEKRAEVNP
jgi:uncharacterized protein YbjT (DUF2867 family)